jgi:2-polyprenyl-3-methyl-5-hydroxy-6-metoxy-1,4-benzoquinol methylase
VTRANRAGVAVELWVDAPLGVHREGNLPTKRTYYDHEAHYRRIAASGGRGWDDRRPGEDHGSYEALRWFLDSAWAPWPGARALGLGCGGGQDLILLAERGASVVGIDFAETAIRLAQENAQRTGLAIEARVGDCIELEGVQDAAFDVVVDNHLLHCLVDPLHRARCLASVARVLRTGGTFFSVTMSAEGHFEPSTVDADPVTRVARSGARIRSCSLP